MHSTHNLDDGYMGSGKILRHSIRKHGINNHKKEILEFFETRDLLIEREKEIVNKELISDGKCMNLKEGGDGGFVNEEHMMNCSNAGHKAFKEKLIIDAEFKKRIQNNGSIVFKKYHQLGIHNYNTFEGKQHSDETKKIMSEKAKERTSDKNSQYGTCWITKDGINKKIKKDELETFLTEGWFQGRK
jgi:hypothetical protein